MRFKSLAVLFVLATPLWAADPVIDGKTEVGPGKLVKLTAKGVSDKAGLVWRVSPRSGWEKADTDRTKLQFAAVPGKYTVDLIVVTVKGDGVDVFEAPPVEIVVTGTAPTPPTPPTPPVPPTPPGPVDDGTLGLKKAARDGFAALSAITPEQRKQGATVLSWFSRGHASAVAAGGAGVVNGQFDESKAVDEWATGMTPLIKDAGGPEQWKKWGAAVTKQMTVQFNAGKLKTKADYVAAFTEVADGLDQWIAANP